MSASVVRIKPAMLAAFSTAHRVTVAGAMIPAPTKSLADNKAWVDGETEKWKRIIDEVKIDLSK